MMRVSQRKLFVKNQQKTIDPKTTMGVKVGEYLGKIIPFPSEQSNTESESGSSTTETRHHENGRENRHHRKS